MLAEKSPERLELEQRAAAALELKRRKQEKQNKEKTVYGIYRPVEGVFGGELIKCIQEVGGNYIEVDKEPHVTIAEKLESFITKKKRFKIALGGRSGTKSEAFGSIFAANAKDYGEKTLCLRELQNSIDDSVHALLSNVIKRSGFTDFDITEKAIRYKSEDVFKFKGMARNEDAVKSVSGFKKSWVEEAQSISDLSLTKLTPSIRKEGSELWFSLNPGSSEDPVSKRFMLPFLDKLLSDGYYEDDLHLIVWINYYDNPWHKELEGERLWDKKNRSQADYDHIWLGHFNDEIENALIKAEWFDACIDAHKKLGFPARGAKFASHDPSDTGGDSKGFALRHGSVVTHIEEKLSGNVNEGGDWACDLAIRHQADHYTWDCDGMGVALNRDTAKSFQGKKIQIAMFKGSESPDNPDNIYEPTSDSPMINQKTWKESVKNKRAQYYLKLRDRIYKTYRAVEFGEYHDPDYLISFCSDIKLINKLRAELCRMPVKPNGSGLFELYTKPEMKNKFKVSSPNLGDSVMMLMRHIVSNSQQNFYIPKPAKTMGRR